MTTSNRKPKLDITDDRHRDVSIGGSYLDALAGSRVDVHLTTAAAYGSSAMWRATVSETGQTVEFSDIGDDYADGTSTYYASAAIALGLAE